LNFLRQHFEKLVLGVVLTALVASIVLIMLGMNKARGAVAEEKTSAEDALKLGKNLEPTEGKNLAKLSAALVSPENQFAFLAKEGSPQGSLVEPVSYLCCVNPGCPYLIPDDPTGWRVCKFCGTEEPPEKKDHYPKSEDEDQDGLPNYVEKNTPFLKADDPTDANQDYDADTFTNLEEYRDGTNMASPQSFPHLARNLRILGKPYHVKIPVVLEKVDTNDAPQDPTKWRFTFALRVRGRTLKRTINYDSPLPGFGLKLTSARLERRPATDGDGTVDVAVATMALGERKYTLTQGEYAQEAEVSTNLLFLATRYKRYQQALERRYRIVRKEGALFQLALRGTSPQELYKVVSIAEDSVVVQLVQGNAGMGGTGEGSMMPGGDGMGAGGGAAMPAMGPEGGGGMMGGGATMPLGPGQAGETGTLGATPEPLEFTITQVYDASKDLIEMPARRPMAPGTMPGTMPGYGPGTRR
jgi:hypothetical protein